MADVVLLYEGTCPNASLARANLMRAFPLAGVPARWREVDLEAADTPDDWKAFGSPTLLVDGQDVAGEALPTGASCRVYRDDAGHTTFAPSIATIAARLAATHAPMLSAPATSATPRHVGAPAPRGVSSMLAALPGIGLALLPKGLCPACWPAYAAVLSALGIGFLMQDRYLLPLTVGFLALATFALAYRAPRRRGYAPALVGGVSGALLVVGKFALESRAAFYAGILLFTAAAVWNAWPLRRAACAACLPSDALPTRT